MDTERPGDVSCGSGVIIKSLVIPTEKERRASELTVDTLHGFRIVDYDDVPSELDIDVLPFFEWKFHPVIAYL